MVLKREYKERDQQEAENVVSGGCSPSVSLDAADTPALSPLVLTLRISRRSFIASTSVSPQRSLVSGQNGRGHPIYS